jgi:hypothetical protein
MSDVYVGDFGFIISFISQYDLTGMTGVRLLIKRPKGETTYEFQIGEYNTVGIGDSLSYTVRDGDLNQPGEYEFQVAARVEGVLDIAFDPFKLEAASRSANTPWPA